MAEVVPLLKFTPSAQDPELLEAMTVQREELVQRLVSAAQDSRGGARHQLVVGPRGIGKTHVVSLVVNRIRRSPDGDDIVIAWLLEDPWGMRGYSRLLSEFALTVAKEVSSPELEGMARSLRARGDREQEVVVEARLKNLADDRRVLLFLENLDDTFARIGEAGQERLRALAEDWRNLLIVGTSPQLFDGVRRHRSPFYGFFNVTHLDELSLESATELLSKVSAARDDQRLARFLSSDLARRRLTAVQALAGGHPRVWLLLAGCLSVRAIDELVPLFLEAVDELTPYYQDRLRALGDQQQEILLLLCDAGGARTNRELAATSGIADNQVATILRRLADSGLVRRAKAGPAVPGRDRRRAYWELSEPLMRLCLDVKRSRGEPLRIIVEFLRAWYGARLIDEARRLSPHARLALQYVSAAVRGLEGTFTGHDLLRGSADESLARVEWAQALLPGDHGLKIARVLALAKAGQHEAAHRAADEIAGAYGDPMFRVLLSAMAAGPHARESNEAGVRVATNSVLSDPDAGPVDLAGGVLGAMLLESPTDTVVLLRRLVRSRSADAFPHAALAANLSALGEYDEAADEYQRAYDLDSTSFADHAGFGRTLARVGRWDQAAGHLRIAVADRPEEIELVAELGFVLIQIDEAEDALALLDAAIRDAPSDPRLHAARSGANSMVGRLDAAVDDARLAIPGPVDAHGLLATALTARGRSSMSDTRLDESERDLTEAIGLDPTNSWPHFALVELHLRRGDAPAAMNAVDVALDAWDAAENHDAAFDKRLFEQLLLLDDESLTAAFAQKFVAADAQPPLAYGVVGSIGRLLQADVDHDRADAWAAAWTRASDAAGDDTLTVAAVLLGAAARWKRDRDEAHVLGLPQELRTILLDIIERS